MKKTSLLLIAAMALLMAACREKSDHLVILHTNDTHSQVEPFGSTSTYPNRGGYARRMLLLDQLHEQLADTPSVLLDAGDFCQGTPYFNFYHGRVEVDALNRMHYDAATLGNHEFDNGMDTLAMVVKRCNFPVVCANYDFTGTPLEGLIKPYTIIRRGGLKIGVFGMGVDLTTLVAAKNRDGLKYLDPIPVASQMVAKLRMEENCDVVIMLSHLGYQNSTTHMSDEDVVHAVDGIDAVVSGHTHRLVTVSEPAPSGDSIVISQMQKSGLYLGRIDLELGK